MANWQKRLFQSGLKWAKNDFFKLISKKLLFFETLIFLANEQKRLFQNDYKKNQALPRNVGIFQNYLKNNVVFLEILIISEKLTKKEKLKRI